MKGESERKLFERGWKKEGPYLVDRSKRNDFYGLMLQGIDPVKAMYPNPAGIC